MTFGRSLAILRTISVAAVTTVASCENLTTSLERDPKTVSLDEIVILSADATSGIPADGQATARLRASIPIDATLRNVTFTTNAGLFVETNSREVRVFATPDAASGKRVSSTLLRSDTLAATAIVRATIGDYYDTLSVRFIK